MKIHCFKGLMTNPGKPPGGFDFSFLGFDVLNLRKWAKSSVQSDKFDSVKGFFSTQVRSTPQTFGYSNLWSRSRRDLDHRFWGTGKGMTGMSWLTLPLFHTGHMFTGSDWVVVLLRWPGRCYNASITWQILFQTCQWLTRHLNVSV